jgi:glutaredoxin
MPVKLHTCNNTWVKIKGHPCHKVRKALDDAGVEYELVKHRSRDEIEELSGQKKRPVLELEDGTVIREESDEMVARIKEGRLKESKPGVVSKLLGRD